MYRHFSLPDRSQTTSWLVLWGTASAVLIVLMNLLLHGRLNLLITTMIAVPLLLLAAKARETAICLTISYLFLLGDIRRIADVIADVPLLDTLLLIGPAVAIILGVPQFLRLRLKDPLSRCMFGLTVVMVLEIANPRQGGLAVGLSGALFYLVPVLWFWIGRAYGTPALLDRFIYKFVFPIVLAAALLGLYQTYVGFLGYEQKWVDSVKQTFIVLNVGGGIRAFGFSVSNAEYAYLVLLGAAGLAAAGIAKDRKWFIPLPLLIFVVFLTGSRGAVLRVAISIAIVFAVRKAKPLSPIHVVRVVILSAVVIGAIVFAASKITPGTSVGKSNVANALVARQVGGLSHPFDKNYSTSGIHNQILLNAFREGFIYPIGRGLGSTTPAAAKIGATDTLNSEVDFGDMFIGLGLPGGLLFLAVVVLTIKYVFEFSRTVPRRIGLPVLGMVIAALGGWLVSGQYSTSAFYAFLIGSIVRAHNQHELIRAVGDRK